MANVNEEGKLVKLFPLGTRALTMGSELASLGYDTATLFLAGLLS